MNITIINHIEPPIYDPLNLPKTVSKSRFTYDEIHEDAKEIIDRLLNSETEGAVRQVIFEYFGKYFGADICGEEWDEVKDGVLDLWRYCTK